MSNNIHNTAIIDSGAQIGENVLIGPYCTVSAGVKIHDDVQLHSHVCVQGNTEIGQGTEIFPFASIGSSPQDLKYKGEASKLIIGKNNVIREHVTMNPGTEGGGMLTKVGDQCLFMVGSHVAHDCMIGNNVIMANNATLGGHVIIGEFAVIGGMSAVHQFIRIGEFAVIGGMSGVDSDVIPYGRVKGERAFLAGLNLTGLERGGFNKDEIKKLQKAFKQLFSEEGTMEQRIETIEVNYAQDDLVKSVIEFARNKNRFPLCQPQKKAA